MIEHFGKHSNYKESGLDWMGRVPEHWQVLPARVAVSNLTDKNDDAANQDYLSLVAGKGVIPYAEKGEMGNKKPDDLSKCKLVHKGNIVINSMNFFIGAYGMSYHDGVCSPVYIVLDVKPLVMNRRFALRVFGDAGFQVYLATFGDGILKHRAAIGWDDIKGTYLPVPPLEEQTQIAKFLDYETAKIDALIDKQQQLIELLKEKRQAVISHAVTKGLNPDAPTRDSGVEWLGEVPAHWRQSKVGRLCAVISKGTTPVMGFSDEEEIPYVRVNNLTFDGSLSLDDLVFIKMITHQVELARSKIYPGDILMNIVGPPLGKVSVVSSNYSEYNINQAVAFFRAVHVDSSFLAAWLQTSFARDWFWLRAKKTSGQANLTLEHCRNLPIAIPPLEEQKKIVVDLTHRIAELDRTLNMVLTQLELLQERRTALISAAVTGKIDVRGWQPPATESAGRSAAAVAR